MRQKHHKRWMNGFVQIILRLHRGLTEKERKYKIGVLLLNLVPSIVFYWSSADFRAANIVL